MASLIIPEQYHSVLNILQTEEAIKIIKDSFEKKLAEKLHLMRISAPLFVRPESGLNDDLNGVERPVQFDIASIGADVQIVHSLAKWKRMALHRYGFGAGAGIYTDMNAIRRDEDTDNIHSVYVDQWDWEKVVTREERNKRYLTDTVGLIFEAICETEELICGKYKGLTPHISPFFQAITTSELEAMFPLLSPKEREDEICRRHGSVFLMEIGGRLPSGKRHDGRAPDYDDWTLNGDILIWYEPLRHALELSSMGIRVDAAAMKEQLAEAACPERASLTFHKMLLNGELPLTIGGGIGQSRMCMVLLQKAHIGEVQCAVWPEEMIRQCRDEGIFLL